MSRVSHAETLHRFRKPNRSSDKATKTIKRMDAYDSSRVPIIDNGEQEVAALLSFLGIEWVYEKWLYRVGGVSVKPDFWLPKFKGREVHIEVTDSAHEWGCNKQGRLSTLERLYGIPVWFINSYTLVRLRKEDGADVAHYCLSRVAFKQGSDYGSLLSPVELLRPLEQAA